MGIDINKAVLARLKVEGETFEVLVDCEKALDFRHGKGSLDEALAGKEVFKDSKKGLRASEHEMQRLFKTDDPLKVAEVILKKGEIQLTAEHRNRLREDKRKQIVAIIARGAIDPKTGLPHPPKRIELALEQAKIKIDEFRKAEEQVKEIVDTLRPILPIKFEHRELEVVIPAKFASQSYHILKRFGDLKKDEWLNDGSLRAVLHIPAGVSEEFENELNKLTHGENQMKVIKVI